MFPTARLKAAWARATGRCRATWCVRVWKTPAITAVIPCTSVAATAIWTGDNSCQVALNRQCTCRRADGDLRFKARWLHGWPEALLRLNGNWLEAAGPLPVPANLGTPGMPNSQYVTNAGPAIYNVTHTPPVPAASQPVVVTAQVHDPNGVQNLTLYYRLDPATTYTAVPMKDDGTGGDAVAGDGIFSATIPGQAANQIVAFYISATDSAGRGHAVSGVARQRQRAGARMRGDVRRRQSGRQFRRVSSVADADQRHPLGQLVRFEQRRQRLHVRQRQPRHLQHAGPVCRQSVSSGV